MPGEASLSGGLISVDGSGVVELSDLSRCPPVEAFVGRWWVLHTRARNEKAVATDLQRHRVQHFLPLVRRMRIYSGRKRIVELPLFPGYVFLCGDLPERHLALQTHRVAQVLEVADQDGMRFDLAQIQRVVESEVPVDLYPRLRVGARCRVRTGSLMGLEGVVLRRRGPWRVYVGVQFVGQSAELEIEPDLLELLD